MRPYRMRTTPGQPASAVHPQAARRQVLPLPEDGPREPALAGDTARRVPELRSQRGATVTGDSFSYVLSYSGSSVFNFQNFSYRTFLTHNT